MTVDKDAGPASPADDASGGTLARALRTLRGPEKPESRPEPAGHASAGTLARALRALRGPENQPEPMDAVEWLRSNGVTVAALTMIAIQLLWVGVLLAHSYFIQDDYRFMDRALAMGFNWPYLMWVEAGHLLPFGLAIAWVLARVSLYNWPLACLSILVLLAAVCLALLRALRTLFGNRPAILILLALYVFSPLLLAAVGWWVVAIELVPLVLAIFMAVSAHVRYLRTGRFRSALAAAGWLLFGMAAADKGAVIPLLLFALTSAFFVEGRWAVAAARAARRYWRAWLLYGVLLAGYGVVFLIQLVGSRFPTASPSTAPLASFASTLVGSSLIPGLLGGPWKWLYPGYAMVGPPAALQQLSWAVAAVIVIVSCWYRSRAWRAWAILFAWVVVADIVPVAIGRLEGGGIGYATLVGMQARYVTDAAAVFVLCLGFTFLPLAGEPSVSRFRLSAETPAGTTRAIIRSARAATVVALAVFLAGSFWSRQSLEGLTSTQAARSYIATARAAVAKAPHRVVIVDRPTPAMIMNAAFFYPWGNTSHVIGAMARGDPAKHLSWILSPHGVMPGLMTFNDQGQLRPAVVAGLPSVPLPHGQRCWRVTTAGASIPLRGSLFRWAWTVQLDYSGPSTVLALRFGEKWADVTLPAGTHAFYVPLVGSGKQVTVRQVGPWPVQCLTGLTVGSWQAAQSGPAIPKAPLPG